MRRWSRARDDADRGARTAGSGPRVEGGSQRGGDSGAGVVALAAMSGAGGGEAERGASGRRKAEGARVATVARVGRPPGGAERYYVYLRPLPPG